jgi:hypothetical protein
MLLVRNVDYEFKILPTHHLHINFDNCGASAMKWSQDFWNVMPPAVV